MKDVGNYVAIFTITQKMMLFDKINDNYPNNDDTVGYCSLPDGRIVGKEREQRREMEAWVFKQKSTAFPDQTEILGSLDNCHHFSHSWFFFVW